MPVAYRPEYLQKAYWYFARPKLIHHSTQFLVFSILLAAIVRLMGWNWASGLLSAILIFEFFKTLRIFRTYRARVRGSIQGEIETKTFRFTDEGVSWKSNNGAFDLPWKNLKAIHRLPGLWLVSLNTGVFIPLPMELMDDEFRSFLAFKEPPSPKKKYKFPIWPLFLMLCAGSLATWFYVLKAIPGTDNVMEFQGQTFRLSKVYVDYDDYKNDPHNLTPEEIARIEKIILNGKIAMDFKDPTEFFQVTGAYCFPGYGSSGIGVEGLKRGEPDIIGTGIEIPQKGEDRYFFARQAGGHYHLVDDFVLPEESMVVKAKWDGRKLLYYGPKGKLVREKRI